VSDTPVPTDGDPFANSIDYGFLLDTTSLGSRPAFSEAYDAGWDAAASEGNQQALNLVGIFLAATGAVEVGGPADNSVSVYLHRASNSLPPFVRLATALAAIEFTAGSGVFGQAAEGVEAATTAGKLPWGFFSDYPKVVQGGTEYAQIGERLFTEHAVERMLPTGMGGRGIAPGFVEDAIATGAQSTQMVNGVARTIFTSGNVQVVTEQGGNLVVTVMRIGGQ